MAAASFKDLKQRPPQIPSFLLAVFCLGLLLLFVSAPWNYGKTPSYYNHELKLQRLQTDPQASIILDKNRDDHPKESISCDLSNYRTAVCRLTGDVRVSGSTVALLSSDQNNQRDRLIQKIKPYPRKWQKQLLTKIGEISVKSLRAEIHRTSMICDVNHTEPAVVFSTGGYTGSIYHDFNDGLIPIYVTAHGFQSAVVFMILEYKPWWMKKYGSIVKQMTQFPVIDFASNKQVRCFSEVIVGLQIHDELAIDPRRMLAGKSIKDFQSILKAALSSPQAKSQEVKQQRPRLVLITRRRTRVFQNEKQIIRMATTIGFEVQALEPGFNLEMAKLYNILQSADVLVGVHGAALTHFLFMRPGCILLQIVLLGTESPSVSFYGNPAMKAGLQYMEYRISASESSLTQDLGRNHTAVVDPPKNPASSGWTEMKKLYLDRQNVTISLSRFKPVLQAALERISIR